MDERRFDQFTLRFARGISRRGASRLLAGLAITASLSTAPESLGKRKRKKKCKKGTQKCGKVCVNLATNALHCGACGNNCAGRACQNGVCQTTPVGCPAGQVRCGGLCVDLRDNEQHCGSCGNACAGELTCLNSTCGCATGAICGAVCADTQADDDHCGDCNQRCGAGTHCVAGACQAGGCGAGQKKCGDICIPDTPDACCEALDCGPSRGGNDIQCNFATHRCECKITRFGICSRQTDGGGTCGPCCGTGDHDCGDSDLTCVNGACGCPPESPVTCGNGLCSMNTQSDPKRCGSNCEDCTRGGTAIAGCCNGRCVGLAGCAPGTSSNECFNNHCGACGNICGGEAPMCCNNGGPAPLGMCKAQGPGGFCPPAGALRQVQHNAGHTRGRRARGRQRRRD